MRYNTLIPRLSIDFNIVIGVVIFFHLSFIIDLQIKVQDNIHTPTNYYNTKFRLQKILCHKKELHPTKSQQVDYHIFGNILIRDYLNFNTTKSKLNISKRQYFAFNMNSG